MRSKIRKATAPADAARVGRHPGADGPRGVESDVFRDAARRASEWVADYRARVADYPVLPAVSPGEIAARLPAAPPEAPESIRDILADLDRVIVPGVTHWNHPGFFAYFSSSSSLPGTLAEFVTAGLGVQAMLWRTSPAATELEERMISWLAQLVGLPRGLRGVILDTASTGSFTALVAAREALGIDVREQGLAGRADLPRLTAYISEHAHSSLHKAAIAAGIGTANMRLIPCDSEYRMRVDELARRIDEDRRAGCLAVMVCATIGTTSSTSVDPVAPIATVCEEAGVWLHVDAAHAGMAAMLPELAEHFTGWERADSIVINPHKWMFSPMDCSVLFFRRPEIVRRSLAITPEFLRGDDTGTNLMDYGLALGRRFRALKLWFIMRYYGTTGLKKRLRDHIAWAREFAEAIAGDTRFTLAAPVPFSTVCFRAVPPSGADGSEWNRRLLKSVNGRGRVFLSHTELDGEYTLRLSVGSVHCTADWVRLAFAELAEGYDRLLEAFE